MRAVIRLRAFDAGMPGLACLAALLLALVPTLGRLAGAQPRAGGWENSGGHWTAICTAAGLEYVRLPAAGEGAGGDAGTPSGHAGADCDYCPLLASLLFFALCLALFPPCRRQVSSGRPGAGPCRGWRHPCGLGSRGPPLAL